MTVMLCKTLIFRLMVAIPVTHLIAVQGFVKPWKRLNSSRLFSTTTDAVVKPPVVAYLDLDETLIDAYDKPMFRPNFVPFLNALHDNNIECRLFTNNCADYIHAEIKQHLSDSNCKVTLHFPTKEDFKASGESDIMQWRQKNPHLGFVRSHVYERLTKDFSKFLIDPVELDRAVLLDDDLFFWPLNVGRFIPAVGRARLDWETGLMDRILPTFLQIQQGYYGKLPSNITEETLEVIKFAETVFDKESPPLRNFAKHPDANRLWYNTVVAFPEYSREELVRRAFCWEDY